MTAPTTTKEFTRGWPRKLRRADRSVRIHSSDPLVVDFTAGDKRGAARARLLDVSGGQGRFAVSVKRLGIPDGLRVVPETTTSLFWQRLGGADVQTGDADFDAAVNLSGPPAWILAALSGRARKELRALLDGGGRVEGGRITLTLQAHRPYQLVAHIHQLLRLARRLSIPDSEVTRLLGRRARDLKRADAKAAVARQLIKHAPLIESFSELAPVYDALMRSPVHRELAHTLRRAWVTGDASRVAQLGEDEAIELLELGTLIRIAAIKRLGQVGSQAAIAPLTRASRGFFTSTSVKRAAKAALDAVLAREGLVEAGGLTLTAADGRLSLDD